MKKNKFITKDKAIDNVKTTLKGFLIGIANIIPGVSGGTLAMTLGIYEKLIKILSNIKKNLKKNLSFLLYIIIGVLLAIGVGSYIIDYTFKHYQFITVLFFVGLIIGGIPLLYKKVEKKVFKIDNIITFIIPFSIILLTTFMTNNFIVSFDNMNFVSYILLFLVGVLASATMVIPGISGSLVLMLIGYYEPIISTLKDLFKFNDILDNLFILIPFGIGILIGIVLISKFIDYALSKYKEKTYCAVLGFVIASIVAIVYPLFSITVTTSSFVIAPMFLVIGFIIAYKLGEK